MSLPRNHVGLTLPVTIRLLTVCGLVLLGAVVARAQTAGDGSAGSSAAANPAHGAGAGGLHSGYTEAKALERMKPVGVPRFAEPVVVDGRLDEKVWEKSAVLNNFYQVEPGDNVAPSQQTEVLLGYDANNFYVAFRAFDEPGQVRATLAKRDAVFEDDNVTLLLDTYNDRRKAYVLVFNPLGVQADGIFVEGGGEDYNVDILMESKGSVTESGYVVEVAIPFKSLRYEAGREKTWGIHVFRRLKRYNNELDSWMPISRNKSGRLNQQGYINGLEGLSTGRALEVIPTLTLSETGQRVRTIPPSALSQDPTLRDPGRFVNQPVAVNAGLTVKYGVTPNVTLALALKPDFAEVEADQAVVRANQRFPVFFPEKRPFFLEGIDIFQTPLQAVNTRAIISPELAVKLTGKSGRNTFGLLLASDSGPGDFTPEERLEPRLSRFIGKDAYVGVLRLKRDVGSESSLGLIATSYSFIDKHNHVGGFDGHIRVDPQTTFDFQVLGTTSRRPFRDPELGRDIYRTGNGLGYSLRYEKAARHFTYRLSGAGRSRDYRADVGFTRRTDTNYAELFLRYASEPQPKAQLISWKVSNIGTVKYDWSGRMQNWFQFPQVTLNFRRQTFLGLGAYVGYERVFEEEFGRKRTATRGGAFAGDDGERHTYYDGLELSAGATPSKKFSGSILLGLTRGGFDFDLGAGPRFPRVSPGALVSPAAPRDPGPGDEVYGEVNFAYQPTPALRAAFIYKKVRLVRNDTRRVAFDEDLYTLRTTYQFSRSTFVRLRADYETLTLEARGQLLLGWTPHPGTSLYVGYNDVQNYNGFNPFTGHSESGLRRNERMFFVKMSYLFRRSL